MRQELALDEPRDRLVLDGSLGKLDKGNTKTASCFNHIFNITKDILRVSGDSGAKQDKEAV